MRFHTYSSQQFDKQSIRRRASARLRLAISLGLLTVAVAGLIFGPAQPRTIRAAMTLTVTSSGDSGPGSLRQAVIDAADGDAIKFNLPIFSTITLTSGQITIDKNLTIEGSGASFLTVRRDSSASAFRIFEVTAGKAVAISGLTISGGSAPSPFADSNGGCILNNGGTLTISNSIVFSNSAANRGGGIFNNGGTLIINNTHLLGNSSSLFGGGIDNNFGTLAIRNCTVSGNSASSGGGIFNNGGTLTINYSTFSSNSASGSGISRGGGIFNNSDGMLTINNSTLSGNSSSFVGGGIRNDGTLTLNSSIVANNTATTSGPDISAGVSSGDYNLIGNTDGIFPALPGAHNITNVDPMLGPLASNGGPTQTHALMCGSPAIDKGINPNSLPTDQRGPGFFRTFDDPSVADASGGNATDIGAFEVQQTCDQPPMAFTVTSSADSGAGSLREAVSAAADGDRINFASGISTITLTSGQITIDKNLMIEGPGANVLTVMRDSSASAFGIFEVTAGRTVNISGLTISGGSASNGGGIRNFGTLIISNSTLSGNSAFRGGGIENTETGTMTISNSTLSGNSASSSDGGGIRNFGTLTISNSTLSGNSAKIFGGGIENTSTGALIISNSTVSGNSAGGQSGGIRNDGTLTLNSSIVANNIGGANPDISGEVSSGDYNLIENTSGTTLPAGSMHNITGMDPMLSPLAFNGGPTQTHALRCGSPAIDKGKNFTTFATDQRGPDFPRTIDDPSVADASGGDGTDIGAVELQQACPVITCPSDITVNTDQGQCSASVTFNVTATGIPTPAVECKVGNTVITSPHAFPVGTTAVTCTATNSTGIATCSFNVTVNDAEKPSITSCPANITMTAAAGQCTAMVNYTTPAASDNCGASVVCYPPSGSAFPQGTTTVTRTASDNSNNTASCSFTVTVIPPPGKATGGGQINVAGGEASFGLTTQRDTTGGPVSGNLNYLNYATGLHINGAVSTLQICGGNTATFTGSSGSWTYKVTVQDLGEPGKGSDTFAIEVLDGSGNLIEMQTARAIARGNLQVKNE